MVSKDELYILSYYRACELAGSILFGRLAFTTGIDDIRVQLTRHFLEEAEHAWIWTKTIKDLGYTPLKVTETYQREYGKEFGMPQNMLEILCLTQVFEKRTLFHFKKHLNILNINSLVKQALIKMIQDEEGHVGWVKKELEKYSKKYDDEIVQITLKKLHDIDEKIYNRLYKKSPFQEYFG